MSKVKLTIDDVIAHCDRKVDSYKSTNIEKIIEEYGLDKNFIKEYLEHKQVAEWLRELKHLRSAKEQIIDELLNLKKCYLGDEDAVMKPMSFADYIQEIIDKVGGIE